MLINQQLGQINLKIVYYGPALSGKTTNLEQIQKLSTPKCCKPVFFAKNQQNRTLHFDFLKLELNELFGLTPNLHLFSVPGQSYYESSRKMLLHSTDGIVFVADSAPNRIEDNRHAWQTLNTHLNSLALSISDMPLVLQLNKQDLPNALPENALKNILNITNIPIVKTIAITGQGVMDTFRLIVDRVLNNVRQHNLNNTLY